MHQSNPSVLVSVIVPLYNAEKFVLAALKSILQEQRIPLEVIVINDRSTDNSLKQISSFLNDDRLRIIDNPGKGIADALNAGLAIARGEFITRCDADDLYPPGRLVQQVDWLKQHPEYGAICGGYSAINSRGATVIQFECGDRAEEITQEMRNGKTRTHLSTFTVQAETLRALGGFRPYFSTAEDIDLQLRLAEVCQVWYEPGVYYYYRLHNTSITHCVSSGQREFFHSIAYQFQQQRLTEGQDDLQRGYAPLVPNNCQTTQPFTARQHVQSLLVGRAWQEHKQGERFQAVLTGIQAVLTEPNNWSVWRSLIALVVKSPSSGF